MDIMNCLNRECGPHARRLDSQNAAGWRETVLPVLISVMMLYLCAHNGGQVLRSAGPIVAITSSVFLLLLGAWVVWRTNGVRATVSSLLLMSWLGYMVFNFVWLGRTPVFGKTILIALLSAGILCASVYRMREDSLKWLFGGLMVLGLLIGVCALFQFFVDPSWHPVVGSVKAQYGNRVSGLFGQPNSFAIFMLMLLPYTLLRAVKGERFRAVFGGLALLFMWCVIVSQSRAVTLCAFPVLAASAYFSANEWRARVVTLVCFIGVFGVLYFGNSLFSVAGGERFERLVESGGGGVRIVYYAAAVDLILQKPLFGVGFGNFQLLWDRQFPVYSTMGEEFVHSDYLQILCETGFIGLGLFLSGVVLVLLRAWGSLRACESRLNSKQIYAQSALCGLVGFALHEMVDIGLQMISVLFLVAIYLAVLMQQDESYRKWTLNRAGKSSVSLGLLVLAAIFLVEFLPSAKSLRKSFKAWGYASYIYASLNEDYDVPEGNLQGVTLVFDESIELDSRNVSAYFGKGRHLQSYQYLENVRLKLVVEDSVEAFDLALSVTPQSWRLWAERGVSLGLDPDRVDEADASYQKALELAPMHAMAWKFYAQHLRLYGRDAELRVALLQILSIDTKGFVLSEWAEAELLELDAKNRLEEKSSLELN